jgi:hypothetical protein
MRQHINEEIKRKEQIEQIKKQKEKGPSKSPLKTRQERFDNDMRKRAFPERYVYVVVDGQDLFSHENLKVIKIEINARLCKIIPQKIWESKQA